MTPWQGATAGRRVQIQVDPPCALLELVHRCSTMPAGTMKGVWTYKEESSTGDPGAGDRYGRWNPHKKKKMQNLELGWFCAAGGSGSGVIFQAEETYVQGFLELRGDAGAGAKSGAGGMGERSAS